ncbi:MAG TPA: copper chaperone PCu(A)C [Vicinamibacterales bacterium]
MGVRIVRRTERRLLWWAVATLVLLAGVSGARADAQGAAPLTISEAWVRPAPKAGGTSAAYMQIDNRTAQDVTVSHITSAAAEVVEAHRTRDDRGMMRMEMVPRLIVPAKGRLTLEPGALHLMLIRLRKPLRDGETVPIVFHLADAPAITVAARVREAEAAR